MRDDSCEFCLSIIVQCHVCGPAGYHASQWSSMPIGQQWTRCLSDNANSLHVTSDRRIGSAENVRKLNERQGKMRTRIAEFPGRKINQQSKYAVILGWKMFMRDAPYSGNIH